MAKDEVPGWVNEEAKRIETERAEWLVEQGFKKAVTLKKGENKLVLDLSDKPKQVTTKFGKNRYVLNLVEPADKCLMATAILYNQILQKVASTKSFEITLLRSGDGEDTKIELL